MSENNKTYRIHTTVGSDKYVNVMLEQDYENFEILSLKIDRENAYKMHTSNYGCIAGRVLANGAYGIPNAKISVFIPTEETDEIDPVLAALYPYQNTIDKNSDNVRYNTLPDEKNGTCHQVVGTFPNKRLVLDDDNVLEIYDKYYKYSAVSNESGDYMIFGVPTGEHIVHVDIDLSDIGDLSQTPRDMIFKGYDINQFESPSMFKKDSELDALTQIISQDSSVFVNSFWGDDTSSNISITRNDIDIKYKFEPTCVFIGSLITDGENNGISQNCIPTRNMGSMGQLKGGSGTIEMIRKTPEGDVESFVIKGTKLIDGNGTWCYQIPMNLDYMGTDEYGNTVATNDPNKGIPTRARVRFRVSLTDASTEYVNNHLAKVLIPNNPSSEEDLDYAFGTYSKDNEEGTKSFRDLFTNNVYTVKSYIPRIQKSNAQRNEHFSGFKNVNVTNGNNPLPYNNMRVNISFVYILQCAILKIIIRIVRIINKWRSFLSKTCIVLGDGVCPDLEGWYFAPGCWDSAMPRTLREIDGDNDEGSSPLNQVVDTQSIDSNNADNDSMCITSNIDYLMQCVEINLAMEYQVIKFDFYNDWINGMIYIPHWYGNIRKKRTYLFGLIKKPEKVQACMEDTYFQSRKFIQQCALTYSKDPNTNLYTRVTTKLGCKNDRRQKCHMAYGRNYRNIMGKTGGLVHNELTLKQEHVYYFRPCEWLDKNERYATKCNLFATDIVMLGSLDSYNKDGIPSAFNDLSGSSFKLPGNLVQTNLETDTPLYAMSNGSLCVSTKPILQKDGVMVTTDYDTYAANTPEAPDSEDKKSTEYKLSEMSGIDWGFSGPGQGKNNLKDLYFPGGHFLGISCFNPETNIKSCVNLSRACEVGTNLSQYQEVVVGVSQDGEPIYERHIPNGFISRNEINDSNFRNIFATLNFNGLRTKQDEETNYRRYDFVSNISFNFDGALSENINGNNASYMNTPNAERFDKKPTDEKLYQSSVEETNPDYYCFRLGVVSDKDLDQTLRSKYLKKEGSQLSIPMYNNSFYFYFGIKDGQTAYDRFLDEFYAVCPDETLTTPAIEITEVKNCDFCQVYSDGSGNGNGGASFEIDGLGSAYMIKLYKLNEDNTLTQIKISYASSDNKIYIVPKNNGNEELASQYSNFTIGKETNGLTNGTYRLSIVTLSDNSEYTKDFTIETIQPEFVENIDETVTINDFIKEFDGEARKSNNIAEFEGYISFKMDQNVNQVQLLYGDNEVVCDTTVIDDDDSQYRGYTTINDGMYLMYVPQGNTPYTLKYYINCGKDNKQQYLNGKYYYVAMPSDFDFYFGDIDASGKVIKKALGRDSLSGDITSNDKWYKDENLNNLTPHQLWLLEKSLIYDSSMFSGDDKGEHSIPLELFGGKLPYEERISGHGEKISSVSNKYRLVDYVDAETDNTQEKDFYDTYVCDYRGFRFPTHIDGDSYFIPIDVQHLQKLQNLGILNDIVHKIPIYNYNLILKDNA